MNDITQQGINALKAGNKLQARRLLQQAVQKDANDLPAWMWLSATVDSPTERADCLRQVLRIDPANAIALRALTELETPTPAPAADPTPHPAPTEKEKPPIPAPPRPAEPKPDPIPPAARVAKTAKKPARPVSSRTLRIVVGVTAVLIIASIGLGVFLFRQLTPPSMPLASAASAEITPAAGTEVLAVVPGSTGSTAAAPAPVLPTLEPSATPRPTLTPQPTETFVPLGAVVQGQRERIQQQVSDMRGLAILNAVPFNIVSRDRADRYLRSQYVTTDFEQESEHERLTLAALGLASPTYDTVTNRLNRMVDGMGGFYTPDNKEIFILGLRFGAVEHYIYAHQFTHALLDQNYQTLQTASAPGCSTNSEPCAAIAALVEGDAQMLMTEWWRKYSNTADYNDILLYRPAALGLLESNPPPFATANSTFGTERGLKFVNYLYNLGGWPNVNKAYANPPQTSEQIMHPKKYVSGELALNVQPRPLQAALGEGWQVVRQNVLGEWYTYLMLAYGVDPSAQIDPDRASSAAAGWGGDSLQVLQQTPGGATALAVHWAWDDEKEAGEFFPVLFQHLNERYRGTRLDNISGECWSGDAQVSCIYLAGNQTLWLQAPDAATIDLMHALYPEFP